LDVDGGKDLDIFEINEGLDLFEGDIKLDNINQKNSIIGDDYRWPIPVPYYLEDSVEINAKALVEEAFERYRLKTCIDFKPWEGEANYISVFKDNGCYSNVGNLRQGRQRLSLGTNCDRLATIQHEFLHALGFWHEQSRADRDDYVTIVWERIQTGKEHNFNKYNDTQSNSLNVPYDYTSVMHYSKTAFQNGSDPTIVTNIPAFSDVIGQRMDFSDYDLEKLNRLYNCSTSLSFLDTCSFEYNNICGMIQGTGDNADWQHLLSSPGGPTTDHTHLGNCKESGYFMHLSTSAGNTGERALLESRFFYPKRGFQCLEFFYYFNGHESDKLNIWIREYTQSYPNGTLIFIGSVNGQPAEYWQLHHVSLNVSNKFRFVLRALKEMEKWSIQRRICYRRHKFSEAHCPHNIWHIRNFTYESIRENGRIYSPPFYSNDVRPSGTVDKPYDLEIYFHIISGANDDTLHWPCSLRQASMMLMDQHPDIRKRIKGWIKCPFPNGTHFFRGPGSGTDVSHLNLSQPSPPSPPSPIPTTHSPGTNIPATTPDFAKLCKENSCENDGICIIVSEKPVCRCKVSNDWWYVGEKCERKVSSQDTMVIAVSSSVAIFAVMLIVTLVSVFCLKKKHKKQLAQAGNVVSMENVSI
ncbi:hypothetical protein GDO86_011043, partial [Hymenochirus boettgeri]